MNIQVDDPITAAKYVVDNCKDASIYCFTGDLGAGKTTIIQAIFRLFGYEGEVSSPTYAIVNEYKVGSKMMYHMDLYRLKDIDEAMDIGIEDYLFDDNGICLIEWPGLIQEFIDLPRYDVAITKDAEVDHRRHLEIEFVK